MAASTDLVIVANHNLALGAWLAQRYPQTTFVVVGPLRGLAPAITTLARAEGLEAHARSVEVRLHG